MLSGYWRDRYLMAVFRCYVLSVSILLGLVGLSHVGRGQGVEAIDWSSPKEGARFLLGKPYSLLAESDSGQPVSFRIEEGPAVIEGSHIIGTGLGPITAVAELTGGDDEAPVLLKRQFTVDSIKFTRAGDYTTAVSPIRDAAVVGDFAFLATEGRWLEILALREWENAAPVALYVRDGIERLHVAGKFAYLFGSFGLEILDISVPTSQGRWQQMPPSWPHETSRSMVTWPFSPREVKRYRLSTSASPRSRRSWSILVVNT